MTGRGQESVRFVHQEYFVLPGRSGLVRQIVHKVAEEVLHPITSFIEALNSTGAVTDHEHEVRLIQRKEEFEL